MVVGGVYGICMRCVLRNQQKMWYATFTGETEQYVLNEDGTVKMMNIDGELVPVTKGKRKAGYKDPTEFRACIATNSGGESASVEFGVDLAQYSATLVLPTNSIPLVENTPIWLNKPLVGADGTVDIKTADYTVKKISPQINFTKYLLDRVVK